MDDTLRNVTLGLFAFFALHVSLEPRARHGAERQLREAFNQTGTVHAAVRQRGLLGYEANDIWSVDVYGREQTIDRLPFVIVPREGWKGSIHRLSLHLMDFTLAGLPVHRFDADLPNVGYDLGHAFYKSRLVIRGAGIGIGIVVINRTGLNTFLARKFGNLLSDVNFVSNQNIISLDGKLDLFGSPTSFKAKGQIKIRGGRCLDLTEAEILLDDKPLTAQATEALMKRLNPLLDIERDLKLGGIFFIDRVEVGDGDITIFGRVSLPILRTIEKPDPNQDDLPVPHQVENSGSNQ